MELRAEARQKVDGLRRWRTRAVSGARMYLRDRVGQPTAGAGARRGCCLCAREVAAVQHAIRVAVGD